MILHEIFRVVSHFPRYISCYFAENRFPLGQCTVQSTAAIETVYFSSCMKPVMVFFAWFSLGFLILTCGGIFAARRWYIGYGWNCVYTVYCAGTININYNYPSCKVHAGCVEESLAGS